MFSQSSRDTLPELRRLLVEHFKLDELDTLAFDLGIDYESVPGASKPVRARELVLHIQHRGLIPELLKHLARIRPNVAWPEPDRSQSERRVPRLFAAGRQGQLLRPEQLVYTRPGGQACRLKGFLASGEHSEVYRAEMAGQRTVVKWYYPDDAVYRRRQLLTALVERGRPSPAFLWPEALVEGENVPGFGVLIPWREASFKGLVDLMWRRVEPTFRVLAVAGRNLAESFHRLHRQGFCYQDVTFDTVFFDPGSGDIRLGDTDHVLPDGHQGLSRMLDMRFAAPEVIRAESGPGVLADRHMLAVFLFYMLMVDHPLEGFLDERRPVEQYAARPLFIFDPADASNRPVPGRHDNALAFWPIYPEFLRALFRRTFTQGLVDPQGGRATALEWWDAMQRLRDAIFDCACQAETFYDPAEKGETGHSSRCWSCGRPLVLPPRLHVNGHIVVLNQDTRLYPHHLDPGRRRDLSAPLAEVKAGRGRDARSGLKNQSSRAWRLADYPGRQVETGQVVSLVPGLRIDFGWSQGQIDG